MRKLLKSVSVVALLLTSNVALTSHAMAQDGSTELLDQVQISYEKFTLPNGLRVLVHSDMNAPNVFVGMWYGVGSKDEPAGKSGFAHLFEHLLFQPTENRESEYFAPLAEAGAGMMNGTTSTERTNYYQNVPSGAVDLALWMESDRMQYVLGAITQEVLDEQRAVVKNEKRQREGAPFSSIFDYVREGLYPKGHPYAHPIIGSMEDLENASMDDVRDWFGKYYGASNAVLVLSGGISVEDAKEKAARYFSGVPQGEPIARVEQWIPTLSGIRKDTVQDNVPYARLARAWPAPTGGDKELSFLSLASDALVNNKNARLRKRLVDEEKLVTNMFAFVSGGVVSGSFSIDASLVPGADPEAVEAIIEEELAHFIEEGPDADMLESIKFQSSFSMIADMEHKWNVGGMLASGEVLHGDPMFEKTKLAWQANASINDVREAAEKWLGRPYYQVTYKPFPKAEIGKDLADRSSMPEVADAGEVIFPNIEEATLSNGIRIVVAERASIPVVNVKVAIGTGSLEESAGDTGISDLLVKMLQTSSGKLDAGELAAEMDKIAMTLNSRAQPDTLDFNYRILRTKFERSLDLVSGMLRMPAFDETEWAKAVAAKGADLSRLEQNPAPNAGSIFERALYNDDRNIATAEAVKSMSLEQLKGFYDREVAPDNVTIYLAGDISLKDAKKAVGKAFGKWKGKAASGQPSYGEARAPKPRVILVNNPGAVQSSIVAGHALPGFSEETDTRVWLANAVLGGGFEARINMNLREDKGWTYGANSRVYKNGSGDQSLRVSTSVQTDKTAESLAEIQKEFTSILGDKPATSEEYEFIVGATKRSLPGQFSMASDLIRNMQNADRFGTPFDYEAGKGDRLDDISLQDVNDTIMQFIDPENMIWVVVGDLEKIEDKIRALDLGQVEIQDYTGNPVN